MKWREVNEVFKIFRSLLNLFEKDCPIIEMIFWPKLIFFNGISKTINYLVLYIFLEETNSLFI